ncbi:MAG: fumarylacetoacetate hydrolase family protein [Azospirillaceae bacterium]|nr:fumarylacetoacetate hydrolase family protein [Azospirillaceae bacterium]
MKLCRFLHQGSPRFGRVEGEVIVPLDGTFADGWREGGGAVALSGTTLLAPSIPNTFFCAGLNYTGHIQAAAAKGYQAAKVPTRPDIGYRANNALSGHLADIVRPADMEGNLEYEGELVAVIGRPLRHASRNEAQAGIFGWTVGNDVSARQWQRSDRTFWRGKNADTFKPMGPWIETDFDPAGARTRVIINGVQSSEYGTDSMIFSAVDFIVEITRYITMVPGDILWLGTDATHAMNVGDLVEVEVTGLATLANRVVAEK